MEADVYLILLTVPSIGLPCPVPVQGLLPCLIVSCLVMFGCCLLEACLSLKENRRGVDLGKREDGRSRRRGNCAGDILCARRLGTENACISN